MTFDFTHLHPFHGGLHLPDCKAISTGQPVRILPVPPRLILPLQQHIGEAARPVVAVGEHVLKGQIIAEAEGYISVPVHASTSGTITDIDDYPVPHPSGLSAPAIVIESDGRDTPCPDMIVERHYQELDPSELRNRIRHAGIVGLGGAGFPTFIKMNPGPHKPIELLIINGAECEPYISCDDMLMRERPDEIIEGIRILMHALQVEQCVIGIEDNKPEAIAALNRTLEQQSDDGIQVVAIPTLYPSGGEKQLIQILTGREVPTQGLPADIGIVCHNPGTVAAIYHAVHRNEPLISRIVTVTGAGVNQPGNLEVRIGTPIHHLIEACGGYDDNVDRMLMGGPMMGFALTSDRLPVIKTTNCLLATTPQELPPPEPPLPCIRCAECARACPADLLPQQLYWFAHAKDFDKVQDYNLFDCIECGCCAYVCPSHLPLVQYYRFAKTEIWAQERERIKADLARHRHELRLERQEREKRERAERLKQKKKAVRKDGGDDAKKAAIQAALDRAKARKATAGGGSSTADSGSDRSTDAPAQAQQPAPAGDATDNDNSGTR